VAADALPIQIGEKCDMQFKIVFDAIRELMTPPRRRGAASDFINE
jgi:hypothetical protein